MVDNCEICGYDEVVGESGLCESCFDAEHEVEYEDDDEEIEDDLVQILNKNGVY